MKFTAGERAIASGGWVTFATGASLVLHAGIAWAFLGMKASRGPSMPPFYKVELIAAPASPAPSAGVVAPPPTKAPPPTVKAPPRPKADEVAPVPAARQAPAEKRATPSVSDTKVSRMAPAPVAGGGAQGAQGTDVAQIRTEGIDFPFPGYLDNIVRQIKLRFDPPRNSGALKAEVMFLIKRDGTVDGFRFLQRSGSFQFDLEVQGAIDVARAHFGPLPAAFRDDVLPVVFAFDPRLIR